MTALADLIDALRGGEAISSLLRHAQAEIANLVRYGRSRPAWQPECPYLAHDGDLAQRLGSLAGRIDVTRSQVIDQREQLLRDAQSNSPFVCPSELQEHIDCLDLLCRHARGKNLQEFLTVYRRTPAGALPDTKLNAIIGRFATIAKYGLHQAATKYADIVAYPGTPFWATQHGKYISDHGDDWQTAAVLLRRALDSALSERQTLKDRHDQSLVYSFMGQLTGHLAILHEAAAQTRAILNEVEAVRQRESAAVEGVRRVWQGTQMVRQYAYRDGLALSEDDQSLARNWANDHGGSSFACNAMESARCAELVALGIYRDIYGDVEDLSILQKVAPSDNRWRTADIDTSGRLIDVKNARRSFSSPNSYSEHCVKRFKSDQHNRQVVVSGFLSLYLTGGVIGIGEEVVWLGETTLGSIEVLRRQFETDYLQLDLSNEWAIRIPPWLFDYPPECYAERDGAIAAARSPDFILPRLDFPIGMLVLTGRVGRPSPGDPLSEEAAALAQRIGAESMPTRPMLFLHVLDRFCITTRAGLPFSADALRRILFPPDSHVLAEYSDDTTPLAVLDPLNTVKELLEVLEKVAETCAERAVVFTSFRLVGSGVFQGRRGGGSWQTIFAYCGGWRKLGNGGSVKCGQNPLFLGQNEPCGECGKLVCHKCGYCSERCPFCSPRQADWPAS